MQQISPIIPVRTEKKKKETDLHDTPALEFGYGGAVYPRQSFDPSGQHPQRRSGVVSLGYLHTVNKQQYAVSNNSTGVLTYIHKKGEGGTR